MPVVNIAACKESLMSKRIWDEILQVANNEELSEVGGAHMNKGAEFQKHWAIMRMFQMEKEQAGDFLFLFEAIQDVAVLDSSTVPQAIRIYQAKKNERRNNWTWKELTNLGEPKNDSEQPQSLDVIRKSPIGKLYASVLAFSELKSEGCFISNAGCDIPLVSGVTAANSVPCSLANLAQPHKDLLTRGLKLLHGSEQCVPNLGCIKVEKVVLAVDDLRRHLVGIVHEFLHSRYAPHAAQAEALVDALIGKISPLCARTRQCATLDDMRRDHGYSRNEFLEALGLLERTPDERVLLDQWLTKLLGEGMDLLLQTSMTNAAAEIRRRMLDGTLADEELELMRSCDQWLEHNYTPSSHLLPTFEAAYGDLAGTCSMLKQSQILAHFAMRAIHRCLTQI